MNETLEVVLIIVGTGALVAFILARVWPLVLLLPPLLGGLAWYGWEFDDVAGVYAAIIVVLLYVGLAIGLLLRRAWRKRRPSGRFEL